MNLHHVLTPHVESGEIPGLVGLVARDGSVEVEALGRLSVDGPPTSSGERTWPTLLWAWSVRDRRRPHADAVVTAVAQGPR